MLVNNLKFACRQAGRRVAQWKTFDVVSRPGSYAGLHGSRFSIDDAPHETWEGNDIKQAPRTIQVRFSVVPESMVDALRGLREIERKYGRIREYRLLRVRVCQAPVPWRFTVHRTRSSPLPTRQSVGRLLSRPNPLTACQSGA
jgi:hypothetical protein